MATKIKIRRDTSAHFASANPVLADGEVAIIKDLNPIRLKVGDGVTSYNSLPYITLPTATTSHDGLMSVADKVALYGKISESDVNGIVGPALCYNVRVHLSLLSTQTVMLYANGFDNYVGAMAVDGKLITPAYRKELNAGTHIIDLLVVDKSKKLINSHIPDSMFDVSTSFVYVEFGERIISIGDNAFRSATIDSLVFWGPTPPTVDTAFPGTYTVYCHRAFNDIYNSGLTGIISTLKSIQELE